MEFITTKGNFECKGKEFNFSAHTDYCPELTLYWNSGDKNSYLYNSLNNRMFKCLMTNEIKNLETKINKD